MASTTAPLLNLDILAAILAAPGDSHLRLVLADWLQENATSVPCPRCDVAPGIRRYATHGGDWIEDECNECIGEGTVPDGRAEYAEFIMVQVELAKRIEDYSEFETAEFAKVVAGKSRLEANGHGFKDRFRTEVWKAWHEYRASTNALRRRERELFEEWKVGGFMPVGAKWTETIPQHITPDHRPHQNEALIERGFVSTVTCDWQTWTTVASQLVRLSDPCKCGGLGVYNDCYLCTAGRVHRAVQPGMQPIVRVRLSDREVNLPYPQTLASVYPGIRFELADVPETTRPAATR